MITSIHVIHTTLMNFPILQNIYIHFITATCMGLINSMYFISISKLQAKKMKSMNSLPILYFARPIHSIVLSIKRSYTLIEIPLIFHVCWVATQILIKIFNQVKIKFTCFHSLTLYANFATFFFFTIFMQYYTRAYPLLIYPMHFCVFYTCIIHLFSFNKYAGL